MMRTGLLRYDKSFRAKLLRILQISLIGGLVLTGTFIAIVEGYIANDKLKSDLETVAKIIGDRSVAALVFDDTAAAVRNLRAARFHASLVSVCLYRGNGALFAQYQAAGHVDRCQAHIRIPPLSKVWLRNNLLTLSLLSRVEDEGQTQGWVYLEANTKTIQHALLIFVLLTMAVLLIISAAATGLTRRMLHKVMGPLVDLHTTATIVAEDTLSPRRAIKASDDEVGELVDVFNNMLDSIARENLALATSEARFRALTAGAPIGIFQLDRNLNLIYANTKWQNVTGIECQPNAFADHKAKVLASDLEAYLEFWQNNVASEHSSLHEYRYRDTNPDRVRYLMEYISPLRNHDGDIDGYIGTLFDVTDLKDAQLELEKLAFFDPLTDLPNRRYFRDYLNHKLAEAKRTHAKLVVMMVDLDNFKKVNDTLGHDAGDELLKIIADRMKQSVRDQDVVSRMGGDEFLVMLSPIDEENSLSLLVQRIQNELSEPNTVRNISMEISASFGVAIYPDDGQTTEELIKNADIALYHAKELGRHRVSYYSNELDKRVRENLRIESRLKSALDNGVLEIFLQPQFASDTLRAVWAEALLRWYDDTEGYICPERFIHVAQEVGLIHRVGHYVFERVCYDLSGHGKYLALMGVKGISINLSAPELYSRNLLADIRHIFNEFHVDPGLIEIEITESMVMNDIGKAIEVLTRIRDLGCRISIDDFGTGYSSLAYLSRFPISSVKIDRTFVSRIPQNRNDMEIASAIIAMSHKLGLTVVAEGVETEEQKAFLIDQGCELLQGYLLARPENISTFVKRGRQRSLRLVDKDGWHEQ